MECFALCLRLSALLAPVWAKWHTSLYGRAGYSEECLSSDHDIPVYRLLTPLHTRIHTSRTPFT